ncbi:hypothetical protein DQX05_17950 [Paenibacillus thiaminolyticus]|uniref:Uncharacterized protein n=1 Tax=Paenibacillus thiaminolyticus TaxID=49283 RepID=A0A3A3GEV7_PANTH|nr:hypothetical protein DQX05_17950 [Paenibacillus thiaminolyticus]
MPHSARGAENKKRRSHPPRGASGDKLFEHKCLVTFTAYQLHNELETTTRPTATQYGIETYEHVSLLAYNPAQMLLVWLTTENASLIKVLSDFS